MSEIDNTLAIANSSEASVEGTARFRLESIDIMRGIVIVLMTLDHVRDFFHASAFLFDPLDVEKTSAALYVTRWITNFCAPTFVFLAGVSAFLYASKAGGRLAVSRFLLTRGLWLVFLELVVVGFAWNFTLGGGVVGLAVIWAIGASMVVLSALAWLPSRSVLVIGVLIVAGHNALDALTPETMGGLGWVWTLLHEGGPITLANGFIVYVAYPLLPWIGVMAIGYGMGFVFLQESALRFKALTSLGLLMVGGFFVLRGFRIYGDPQEWITHANGLAVAGDFFDVRKYPPSLLYVLITLGPVFLLLPWLERCKRFTAELFATFGRVPLFFYVLHLYLAHGLMMAIGMAMGYPAAAFVGVMNDPGAVVAIHWGFSLPVVYGVWILVLVVLYPACRWFGGVKKRRRDWWLSYL